MARDAEEGIGAFIAKREPKWEDRVIRKMNPRQAMNDAYIREILNTVKTVAMVGASPQNVRPSYFVFKYLAERGYDMIPINPGQVGKSLLGKPFVASLQEIGRPIDMIDIFRSADHVDADRRHSR